MAFADGAVTTIRQNTAKPMKLSFRTSITAALIVAAIAPAARSQGAIAGVTPDRRPATAPAIRAMPKDAAWYAQATRGIQQPYPASLRFLEDQGAWYTPFDRPNTTGRYDIRGFHPPAAGRVRDD